MTATTAGELAPARVGTFMADPDRWWDDFLDRFNPVFVKETRQALKSRSFAAAFLGTLLLTWVVFALMIISEGDRIEFADAGRTMFRVVYIMMIIPLWIVVPATVFSSVSWEFTGSTFELLGVTPLRPMDIVTGKLQSAALQASIYLSAMLPFLAMTFLMQGLDVVAAIIAVSISLTVSALLALGGLMAGSLVRGTVSQTLLTIVLLAACVITSGIGVMVIMSSTLGPWELSQLGGLAVGLICFTYFIFLYVMMTIGVASERLSVTAPRPMYVHSGAGGPAPHTFHEPPKRPVPDTTPTTDHPAPGPPAPAGDASTNTKTDTP